MPGQIWTDQEKKQLSLAVERGLSNQEMLRDPNLFAHKTKDSLQQQKRRLGLADPKRSAASKNAVSVNDEQRNLLERFLMENFEKFTPEELTRIWNEEFVATGNPQLKRTYICRELERLGIKKPQHEVRQMPGSVAKRYSKAAKLGRKAGGETLARKTDAKQASKESKEIARIKRCGLEVESFLCVSCDIEKPLTSVFWREIPARAGRSTYLQKSCCLACLMKRRRERSRISESENLLRKYEKNVLRNRKNSLNHRMKLRTEQRLVEASLELEADPDLPRRYCIDCEEEFPLTEKYFDRSGKGNGLREVCKSCVDERNTMVRRLRRSGASEKSVQSYVCRRVFSANARKRERRKAAELSKIADLVSTDETVELVKCRRCQESFPLERRYWRISKSGYRMPDCCYCEEEKAAERRLAKWIEPSSFDESFDSFLDALD